MFNNNKKSRKIVSTITKIKNMTDINGRDYLILELDNDGVTFVFGGKVSPDTWNQLEERQKYEFEIEEGKSNSNLLCGFKKQEN